MIPVSLPGRTSSLTQSSLSSFRTGAGSRAKGIYESYTGEFTPFENVEFEDEELMQEYVAEVSEIAENKMQISADIVTTDYYAQLPEMLIID